MGKIFHTNLRDRMVISRIATLARVLRSVDPVGSALIARLLYSTAVVSLSLPLNALVHRVGLCCRFFLPIFVVVVLVVRVWVDGSALPALHFVLLGRFLVAFAGVKPGQQILGCSISFVHTWLPPLWLPHRIQVAASGLRSKCFVLFLMNLLRFHMLQLLDFALGCILSCFLLLLHPLFVM